MTSSGYFDYNATAPLRAIARATWCEITDKHWHNPSSLYPQAAQSRGLLEQAREDLADLCGTEPERIIFTSSATEANNHVIHAAAASGLKIALSHSEHPSLAEPATRWSQATAHSPAELLQLALEKKAHLLAQMAAQNETGELFPHTELLSVAEKNGLWVHIDAAQWFGKMPAQALPTQHPRALISGCGHKFGGPKNTGFLIVPPSFPLRPLLVGGPQENRRRAGTEDTASLVAMVAALQEAEQELTRAPDLCAGRDAFEASLGWTVVAADRPRLWNTSMVITPHADQRRWIARLGQRGYAASTGSACSSGQDGGSSSLSALGLPLAEMKRVLRFSSGHHTSLKEWLALAETLKNLAAELA
jgi:cysteine desulfurase